MSVSELPQLIQQFNWHSPSWDLFIVFSWGVASVLYAFTAGRGRIISILMSVYMAKLLVLEAPFLSKTMAEKLNLSVVSLQQLIIFLIIFFILFIFLSKYAFRTSAEGRHLGSVVFGLVFSFLQIGLLINIILTFLPLHVQQSFSPLIQLVFIKQPAGFVWLVAPLVYLVLLGKHIADVNEI